MRRLVACLALVLALASGGCGSWAQKPRREALRLIERGPYQYLVDREGRLLRIAHDRNHDHRADTVVLFQGGRPERGELDVDLDGRLDRWERYGPGGTLEWVAESKAGSGRPDTWLYVGGTSAPPADGRSAGLP